MALDFHHASALESARFSAQVAIPNVIQGLFKKRALPTRLAAKAGVDAASYALMEGLTDKYGVEPFFVKVVAEDTLVVHHPDDIRLVLEGSPARFGSDPDAKRKGMVAFQPDALTLSRGDLWQARRTFAEAVLETRSPLHSLAASFLAKASEEAARLEGTLDWDSVNDAFRRLTRRVVLGEAAADDVALSEELEALMAAGNKMPGEPAEGYDAFVARIEAYLELAEPGSLSGLVASAPSAPGGAAGQIVHWLFAMGDTLPANAFRALALLATHPEQLALARASVEGVDLSTPAGVAGLMYLAGVLQEAMRLWPTTPMFGRVALEDVRFSRGQVLKAGTPVLIVNSFNHRNRSAVEYADRFAPEAWVDGDAATTWRFNFFSNGPQGCPGAGLSIMLGQAVLAHLVSKDLTVSGATLNPQKRLPHALDVHTLKVTLG
jgi:cytochrome P450